MEAAARSSRLWPPPRRPAAVLAVLVAALLLAAPVHAAEVRVRVDRSRPGPSVPTDFTGLSFEAAALPAIARAGERPHLVALLRSIGPGLLRFGGLSVDQNTAFVAPGRPRPAWATTVITPADLSRLRGLLRSTGWRVVLSVTLGHADPAVAAAEARAAARRLGPLLAGIEIGNEPNAYAVFFGLRPLEWGYRDYRAEVRAYRRAIAAAAPGVAIMGPDVTTDDDLRWLTAYARDERPAVLTAHFYPLAACYGTTPTLGQLLGPDVRARQAATFARLAALGRPRGVPVRLDELNDVACGGLPGVSGTQGSALWALQTTLQARRAGLAGVNLHSLPGRCFSYTPLCVSPPVQAPADGGAPPLTALAPLKPQERLRAQPEWYALLALRALAGTRPVPTAVAGAAPDLFVDGSSAPGRRGRAVVVVINTAAPGSEAARVVLHGGRGRRATVLRLTAPSLTAQTGVTLGGAPVRRDGTWRPRTARRVRVARDGVHVEVPAASAAVVELAGRISG